MEKKDVGNLGEKIASYFLIKNGYKILEKNYFKKWSVVLKGEIDIIVRKDDIISFVEVKALSRNLSDNVFLPEDRVDFKKQNKLIKLAQLWLTENKMPLDSKWQIDVISVKLAPDFKKAKIRHFKNAVC